MTPPQGNHYSLPFLPATSSFLSLTLEGLFELKRRPSRALDWPRSLLPELQSHKDTMRCAALVAEVPGHRPEKLSQTLIVGLLEMHLFLFFQILGELALYYPLAANTITFLFSE